LNFTIGELKRKRLAEMQHQFVSCGLPGITQLRGYARSLSSYSGEIVRKMATGCAVMFGIFRWMALR